MFGWVAMAICKDNIVLAESQAGGYGRPKRILVVVVFFKAGVFVALARPKMSVTHTFIKTRVQIKRKLTLTVRCRGETRNGLAALAQSFTPCQAINHNTVRGREPARAFLKLPDIQTASIKVVQGRIAARGRKAPR